MSIIYRIYKAHNPPVVRKSTTPPPLRFGILGTANIAPNAVITPAKVHPEVVILAVAARSVSRSNRFAKRHGIQRAYGSYQELLDDKDIDVIYNPLPNSLHFEWTMKALEAGKHVLTEKPMANTAEEVVAMFQLAEKKGLVLMEAYHYRFHPALLAVKDIIDNKTIGNLKSVAANMICPRGIIKDGDIRFDYSLGGGALMDMGVYAVNVIQFMTSSHIAQVNEAECEVYVPRDASADSCAHVDRKSTATLALPNDVTASLHVDLSAPFKYGVVPHLDMSFKATGNLGTVEISHFVMPTFHHKITVKFYGGSTTTRTVYRDGEERTTGEDWRTTYMFQLGAFVDQVRGKSTKTWVSKEDSVATMECIEAIYRKNGLGSRPKSSYIPVEIVCSSAQTYSIMDQVTYIPS